MSAAMAGGQRLAWSYSYTDDFLNYLH